MHITVPPPQSHGAAGLFHDPRPEVFIGHKQQVAVLGRGLNDLDGIAAGADDVAERFDIRTAVDVSD
jgi:hypothetical protein